MVSDSQRRVGDGRELVESDGLGGHHQTCERGFILIVFRDFVSVGGIFAGSDFSRALF